MDLRASTRDIFDAILYRFRLVYGRGAVAFLWLSQCGLGHTEECQLTRVRVEIHNLDATGGGVGFGVFAAGVRVVRRF